MGRKINRCEFMNPKERILTLLKGGLPDKIPFVAFDRHLLQGKKEREARNRGMGLICWRPCYVESISNVEIVTRSEPNTLLKTYKTPVGSLTEVFKHGAGYGQGIFGRDWKGVQARRTEFLVKKTEDYKILKFIFENLHYEPYYYPVEDQIRRLKGDGIVVTTLPYEPMQRLLIEFVGWKKFYTDLTKNIEPIEEISKILEEKYEKELLPIVADSPSEVMLVGGNIDSILVSPPLFEKYYLPYYSKCANILRPKEKMLDVHIDGRLKALTNLVAKSEIDIIEAFTPPPMGDLAIDRALSMWKNKIIWINFPMTISSLMGPCPKTVKKYLIEQLELMIPGERVMLFASTEDRIPDENLMAMMEIMEKATLPLSKEVIKNIDSSS
jgi:hypothetical protein